MTDADTSNAAWQGFIDKWLAAQPQQRVALVFVDGHRHPGHVALAALEQELLDAAYGIREPQVAAAKLGWWAEELSGAASSGGRHPLTQVLFDDERAQAITAEQWVAPVLAAMVQLEQGTAADFSAQLDAAMPLHGALAALETAWWYGAAASCDRAARLATLDHLLDALLRTEVDAGRDRLSLSMANLARHGLSRAQLGQASAARQQAIQDQLRELLQSWREAARLPGPVSVFRALASSYGMRMAQRAMRAPDALASLAAERPRIHPVTTWRAWQAARAWRRSAS
jgi:phytoene synthase